MTPPTGAGLLLSVMGMAVAIESPVGVNNALFIGEKVMAPPMGPKLLLGVSDMAVANESPALSSRRDSNSSKSNTRGNARWRRRAADWRRSAARCWRRCHHLDQLANNME